MCGHDAKGDATRESFFKAFFKSFKAGLADGTVGRTYFTGVLPITLDDLSSGFNVGTVVSLDKSLLGLAGFSKAQVKRYVDEVFVEHGLDPSIKPAVLADLKAFYDGYRFLPDAESLYNSTICNWYLRNLVSSRKLPTDVIDANVRTDIGWFRRLAGSSANALAKVRQYVESGEGEKVFRSSLSSKFGRAKFFTEEFFPYAMYYLGLLTFENPFRLNIPNLTIKNMFVDYYDELSEFTNVDEARTAFIPHHVHLALHGRSADVLLLRDGIQLVRGALRLPRDTEARRRQARAARRVQVFYERGGGEGEGSWAHDSRRGDGRAGARLPQGPCATSRLEPLHRDDGCRGLRQHRLQLVRHSG